MHNVLVIQPQQPVEGSTSISLQDMFKTQRDDDIQVLLKTIRFDSELSPEDLPTDLELFIVILTVDTSIVSNKEKLLANIQHIRNLKPRPSITIVDIASSGQTIDGEVEFVQQLSERWGVSALSLATGSDAILDRIVSLTRERNNKANNVWEDYKDQYTEIINRPGRFKDSNALGTQAKGLIREVTAELRRCAPPAHPLHVPVKAIVEEVASFVKAHPERMVDLLKIIQETQKLIANGNTRSVIGENIDSYVQLAQETISKRSAGARVAGAMLALAGVLLIAACLAAAIPSHGVSLAGITFAINWIVAGGGIALGATAVGIGAGFFHDRDRDREKNLVKAMGDLVSGVQREQNNGVSQPSSSTG